MPFPGQDAAGCGEDVLPAGIDLKSQRIAVNGAFKTPILRNIALTPPYFHNGGQASLAQVVAFYNRGGDFSNPEKDPDVTRLGLTRTEQDATGRLPAIPDRRPGPVLPRAVRPS